MKFESFKALIIFLLNLKIQFTRILLKFAYAYRVCYGNKPYFLWVIFFDDFGFGVGVGVGVGVTVGVGVGVGDIIFDALA